MEKFSVIFIRQVKLNSHRVRKLRRRNLIFARETEREREKRGINEDEEGLKIEAFRRNVCLDAKCRITTRYAEFKDQISSPFGSGDGRYTREKWPSNATRIKAACRVFTANVLINKRRAASPNHEL